MFLCGSLLCSLNMQRKANNACYAQNSSSRWTCCLFATAIYLGNVPHVIHDHLRRLQGWYYLSFLKPNAMIDPKWFYLFWASTLLVYSNMRSPRLQRMLEWGIFQYLGNVSFRTHLVHGPLLWTLGEFMYRAIGFHGRPIISLLQGRIAAFANRGPLGLEMGFLLSQTVLLPVNLMAAQVVSTYLDRRWDAFLRKMIDTANGSK